MPLEHLAALIISLDKTDINVCVKKELACEGGFAGFKVRFVDNFDQSASDNWLPDASNITDGTNYCFFPQGTYG